MARAIWLPGGGGADLDVVTAAAGDVVKGKVIVDAEGNPLTGTLELTGNAVAGDIIKGRTAYTTNPNSKVTGTLALTGTAVAANLRKGKTMYTTDPKTKITGTMAEQAAQTITPGTANKTIAANRFLTGVQTISGDKNLIGANIIRGKTIFGVAGEAIYAGDIAGYFLEPPKEYEDLTGGWEKGTATSGTLEKGTSAYKISYYRSGTYEITLGVEYSVLRTVNNIDLSKYRYIYVDYENAWDNTNSYNGTPYLYVSYGVNQTIVTKVALTSSKKSGTLKLDVSNLSVKNYITIGFYYSGRDLSTNGLRSYADITAVRYDEMQ